METHLLEFRILSFLRSRDAYLKYTPIVKEYMFESKYSRYIFKLIMLYHKKMKGKGRVPLSSLFTLVSSRIKENDVSKYKEIIQKIKKFPFDDTAIADDVVKNFAKRQITKTLVLDAVNSLDKDEKVNIEKLREKLDEALMVDSSDALETSYDYFTNPANRLEDERSEARVATLLHPEIDRAMHRGLAGGEIALVVAPTNVGKTMFLINIAYNAMKQGKKVVYLTIELSGRKIAGRFDQLVSHSPYEKIEKDPSLVYRATKKLAKLGGGLHIKDSTAVKVSVNDISVYLENLRRNFDFDVLIVDQADLMHSPRDMRERRFELSSIIVGLRRLGAAFDIPVWTASQATRIAGAAGVTTIWDTAEDIGKINWCDAAFTLSQSTEDKEENIMFCNFEKNRIGPGNPRILLEINYPLMKLKGTTKMKD